MSEYVARTPGESTHGDSGALRRAAGRLIRNPVAVVALVWLLVILFFAIFGRWVSPYDPTAIYQGKPFELPSLKHLVGTDTLGRDTYSRLIEGASVAMRSSAQIVALALIIAIPLGLISGYSGGLVDNLLMRLMDVILSFPALALALAIVAVLGPGLNNVTVGITVVLIPGFVRLIRGETLAISQQTFVEASRAIGTPVATILWRRVLPSVLPPLIVLASLALGAALLVESALSFLLLDVAPPTATWGNMLTEGYQAIFSHPFLLIPPGVMISLAILAFNTLGDGLRDALGLVDFQPVRKGGVKRGLLGITSAARTTTGGAAAKSHALLSVRDLSVDFMTPHGSVTVLDKISFDVKAREVFGLVGESGSGKTVTSLAIMRLLSTPPATISSGQVLFDGTDLLSLNRGQLRRLRGSQISMIFQDPMSSLNPAYTVGNQVIEAVRLHQREMSHGEARHRAVEVLDRVRVPSRQVFDEYPHRLSGGMCQRVLIAMALVNKPKLLIADEPTTALDVTIQAQILHLLRDLRESEGMAMIFITHDFGVAAEICDRVAVVYAGQIVEQARVNSLFAGPRHPYTVALMRTLPALVPSGERLNSIPGMVPQPGQWPTGCRFVNRCSVALPECGKAPVPLTVDDNGSVRCIRYNGAELEVPAISVSGSQETAG